MLVNVCAPWPGVRELAYGVVARMPFRVSGFTRNVTTCAQALDVAHYNIFFHNKDAQRIALFVFSETTSETHHLPA